MRIVFSEDGRDFQRRDWTDLVRVDPAGTFFHRPAYLKLYWEEFGRDARAPAARVRGGGRRPPGRRRSPSSAMGDTLRFLGGTEVTDYMGPVGDAGDEGAGREGTVGGARPPRRLALRRPAGPRGGPSVARSPDARPPRQRGSRWRRTEDQNGVAPFLALPVHVGRVPGSAARRSSVTRSSARPRSSRPKPVRSGSSSADHDSLEPAARPIRRAPPHERGPQGRVHGAGHGDLLPPAGSGVPARRHVFRLTIIEVDGQLAAGTIGFVYDETSYLYNSAFDRAWGALAPGMVLVAEDIRLAIDGGCTRLRPAEGRLRLQVPVRRGAGRVRRLTSTAR